MRMCGKKPNEKAPLFRGRSISSLGDSQCTVVAELKCDRSSAVRLGRVCQGFWIWMPTLGFLHMYVCMYACMYACRYACRYVVRTCTHIFMYACGDRCADSQIDRYILNTSSQHVSASATGTKLQTTWKAVLGQCFSVVADLLLHSHSRRDFRSPTTPTFQVGAAAD